MSNLVTGTCNCGRHRYTISKPAEMNLCRTQHTSLSAPPIQTQSPEPKKWINQAESGNELERAWCGECGAGVWLKLKSQPEMTFLKAGLFDHEIPNPTMENWLKNMEPWESPAKGTKRTSQEN